MVLGFYGATLDYKGVGPGRWKWRPSVGLCSQEDFVVDRLELLVDRRSQRGARQVASDIELISPESEVRLHAIDIRDPWDLEEVFATLHDFARTYPFEPEQEDYYLHITTGTHVMQICLFLLAESRHFPARLVQTSPHHDDEDDARKPAGTLRIIDLDLSRYDRIASRFASEQVESLALLKQGIETRSPRFNAMIESLERVATRSREPILLTGPTGAGKSQLARKIYELRRTRRRVEGPLVEVNCATLRGDQAMSALFGHKRGAFTGASHDRAGLLKSADGGLLFLDEIGELGLDEQAMLLRAIEEGRFLPVGTDREETSQFELLAGTNRDLGREVAGGRFREDLYARINVWTFALPGLRERLEDLVPNLEFELARVGERLGERVTFNAEARARFVRFATSADAAWRGNFRDLNAALMRMATLAPGGRIDVDTVDEEIARLRASWRRDEITGDEDPLAAILGERVHELDRFDRVQLADVVRVCRESKTISAAGRTLFAVSREQKSSRNDAARLRKYLARFDLSFADVQV